MCNSEYLERREKEVIGWIEMMITEPSQGVKGSCPSGMLMEGAIVSEATESLTLLLSSVYARQDIDKPEEKAHTVVAELISKKLMNVLNNMANRDRRN